MDAGGWLAVVQVVLAERATETLRALAVKIRDVPATLGAVLAGHGGARIGLVLAGFPGVPWVVRRTLISRARLDRGSARKAIQLSDFRP